MPIFTIGHSTRSVEELVAMLAENGVGVVCDVRSYPRSRRHPQFNAETLPAELAGAGIGYVHLKALGGRRGRQDLGEPSPNRLWREDAFRNYADYALTPPFRAALDDLRVRADETTAAIMCAEAVWWRCHRRIITDHLLAAGEDVVHIMAPGRTEPARLTQGAEPQGDSTVHYPPDQAALL